MSHNTDALKLLDSFYERLNKREAKEMLLMGSKWDSVSKRLDSMILELASKEDLSKNQLFRLDLYKEFLKESKAQTKIFTEFSNEIIIDNERVYAKAGLDLTQSQISLVKVNFQKIPLEATNKMIGLTSDGTKLYDLIAKSYPQSIEMLTNTLVQGIALGQNPMRTASLMKEDMDFNLKRARTIARTEQLRVMRETSREQMIESKVVKEWERIEREDACDECQAVDGQRYSLDEIFDTHPNCRGAMLPIVE